MPVVNTVRMFHRIINVADNSKYDLSLFKQISENNSYDKKIRYQALHFLTIY